MYPQARGRLATFTLLGLSMLFCSGAAGQNARFATRVPPMLLTVKAPPASVSCVEDFPVAPAISDGAANSATVLRPNCETPSRVPTILEPCASRSLQSAGCNAPLDRALAALEGMGKEGRKISRARDRVLEILGNENACSAWYQEKDPNPGATFRVLSFELDRKGQDSVLESRDLAPLIVYWNPYVAWVIQGDGANATITVNAKGAFFSPTAKVMGVRKEGGPSDFRGQRMLRVGPYEGDTLQAQVLTLLHEFGHALDMLPADEHDVGGKSMQNTEEVLRHCRAEVERKLKPKLLTAAH